MKKFNLSVAAVLAMSTFAIAGGDIAPVEPVVEAPVVVESTGGFYLGLAYGLLGMESSVTETLPGGAEISIDNDLDEDFSEIMIQAGYEFNDYIAVEGRYWFGLDEDIDYGSRLGVNNTSIDAWGIYVKPQYPVTEAFNIYALLGYGAAEADVTLPGADYQSDSVDGFSWGIGAGYSFTENIAVFVDYVSIYDDNEEYVNLRGNNVDVDKTIDTWNFGVTYNF